MNTQLIEQAIEALEEVTDSCVDMGTYWYSRCPDDEALNKARDALTALRAARDAQSVELTDELVELAWRRGFHAAMNAERLNADEEWGYKAAEVIDEARAVIAADRAKGEMK